METGFPSLPEGRGSCPKNDEKIGDFGGSDITPVGGAVITDLDGIFSTDTTSTDIAKSVEFLAVSSHHCAECYFRSPTATGYPLATGKQE
jgi:hypothetical protein